MARQNGNVTSKPSVSTEPTIADVNKTLSNYMGESFIDKSGHKVLGVLGAYNHFINPVIQDQYYGDKSQSLKSAYAILGAVIGGGANYDEVLDTLSSVGHPLESLFSKNVPMVYHSFGDHVLRGLEEREGLPGCNFFNFYGGLPSVRLANPEGDKLYQNDILFSIPQNPTYQKEAVTYSYAESRDGEQNNFKVEAYGMPGYTSKYESFDDFDFCDLVKKTNTMFKRGKMETMIARFHTDTDASKSQNNPTQTANSEQYGLSHGRNLLKTTITKHSNYDNPYCRVWTYHYQYHRLVDTIRPFMGDDETGNSTPIQQKELEDVNLWSAFSSGKGLKGRGGRERLDEYGAMSNNTGLVNIAPTAKIEDYFTGRAKGRDVINVKRCMFSIENLAWRDFLGSPLDEFDPNKLSPEQKGPLGGRIMWFPPYDINFGESVSVGWNEHKFIGRGENVYSYSNTDRSGNLSFKILIDHPAIIDYWEGLDRNGMKYGEKELLKGNTGGVDKRLNQENTLLRFFAGCDILSAKPQTYRKRTPPPPIEPEIEIPEPPKVNEDPKTPPKVTTKKSIVCALYFPNNYSGKDDKDGTVDAIDYLMNGIYAQRGIALGVDGDIPTSREPLKVKGLGGYGGYEVRTSPISPFLNKDNINGKAPTSTKYTSEKSQKASLVKNTKCGWNGDSSKFSEYILEDNEKGTIVVEYGNTDSKIYQATKIVGSAANQNPNDNASVYDKRKWEWRKWYYRVDKNADGAKGDINVSNEKLKYCNSYIDGKSYQMNSKNGYMFAYDNKLFSNEWQDTYSETSGDNRTYIAFTDLYKAIEGSDEHFLDNSLYDENNVKIVQDVLNERNGKKILAIQILGHASAHGLNADEQINKSRNGILAENRQGTLARYIKKGLPSSFDMSKLDTPPINDTASIEQGSASKPDVDDQIKKAWRSAEAIIIYEENEGGDNEAENQVLTTPLSNDIDKPEGLKKEKLVMPISRMEPSAVSYGINWFNMTSEKAKALANGIDKYAAKKGATKPQAYLYDNNVDGSNSKNVTSHTVNRYDNEGEFFQELETRAPFVHHLISDKIKYFDPAFHSISPEGFNARLTFLHQCTRQGPTVGATDENARTANNLAFGRPPVCVLRIGDFYNTKIIINSLNITYDPLQWDLNPEGIGVMPMIAKIDINFKFIGGSDLAGPIARLQNALSFNYYANTSVYDNRSEQIEYNSFGDVIGYKGYNPEIDKEKKTTYNPYIGR